MTTVADVAKAVDQLAPFGTQMDWDNSGLLVGDPCRGVTKVLAALDATTAVIDRAESMGAEVIVTHHPVIFRGVKRLLAGDPPFEAAARGIAVISAHTCYDMAPQGVNDLLADALGLRERSPLWEEFPGGEGRTLGVIGELPCPMSREELAAWVEEALGLRPGFVRYLPASGTESEAIRRVAVCGGAGADYLETAKNKGCAAYITGDVRHHEFLAAAEMGLFLMDAGHFATENIAMPSLAARLGSLLPGVEVVCAE